MFDWNRMAWKSTRYPGVSLHFYRVDDRTGRAAVLIRMAPGASYPRHRHRGSEELLVLAGRYEDEFGTYAAGDYAHYEDGTVHHPRCPEDSETCVLFAIAEEGIDLLEGPGPTSNP